MFNNLLDIFRGCSHRRTTFPLTPSRKPGYSQGSQRHSTYVVCLDCGREFDYDWAEMRVGEPVSTSVAAQAAFSAAQR